MNLRVRVAALMVVAGLQVLPALASQAGAAENVPDARRPKKLIAVGWDLFFDTQWLREHRDDMEKRPFDGIILNVVGRGDDKKPCQLRAAFSKQPWKYDWFAGAVEDLKACRFQRLTDNLVVVWANPGDVDWFDDAGWKEIVEHWRIAARVARESGCRGLAFDPEPYTPPHAPFSYGAQVARDRHSFDEYAAKARERGREVMKAVAAEYPNVTILSFFLNSVCSRATGHADPRPFLASEGYGLLPAFLDGWLDAAPPTITLVDGHEGSYCYNSDLQFLDAANLMRGACQELVSPENRAKYRAQVQTGFGIYLDAYVNPPTSPYYVDGKGGPRAERLRANVAAALRASDGYVWIYGEQHRWWPTPNADVKRTTWPEALPGSEDALRSARNPEDWARWKIAALEKAGTLKNLVTNGDFAPPRSEPAAKPAQEPATKVATDVHTKKSILPAGWSPWQNENSHGTFAWDGDVGAVAKGSARLAGIKDGCYVQRVKAEPGKWFAVEAVRRLQGRGEAVLVVRWQTAEEKWIHETLDVDLISTEPRDAWAKMFGVVRVPEGAGNLVILLLARDQASPDDVAWFDDVRVYALD